MGFVCGKPGSGKSFSVKREIMNTILAYPDDEVIVFDPPGNTRLWWSLRAGPAYASRRTPTRS